MGLWREGSGSPTKSKARGLKALSQRSARWVEGSGSTIGSWREGSESPAKSKARGSKLLGRRSVCGFVD